ncbi:MAG: hypothetical protein MJZ26_05490 [Fibrobacter sp.]|nr:hypothetical protein [Fibrobacter sp.]
MNFKFAKTLLMGSVISMGAFGLVACGDDSSSGPSNQDNPGEIVVPTQKDANIIFTNMSKVDAGSMVKFLGSVALDLYDTTTQQNLDNVKFTEITFQVGRVEAGSLKPSTANVAITIPPSFETSNVTRMNLNEMGVSVSLTDPNFTECGDFNLVVTVKANDGTKDFVSSDQIAFSRPDSYCKTVDPTPTEPVVKAEVEMVPYTATVSTNLAPGLNFATGVASADLTSDLIVSKAAGGEITISSGNGTLFSPILANSFYEVGIWPEEVEQRTAYMSDFLYKAIEGTTLENIISNSSQIYVAKTAAFDATTGAGFYAFGVDSYQEGNNKDYTLVLKVYKAK